MKPAKPSPSKALSLAVACVAGGGLQAPGALGGVALGPLFEKRLWAAPGG